MGDVTGASSISIYCQWFQIRCTCWFQEAKILVIIFVRITIVALLLYFKHVLAKSKFFISICLIDSRKPMEGVKTFNKVTPDRLEWLP